jgi:uncharacterized membrane protein
MNNRHVAKTITWRIIGTVDTIIIAYIVSGNLHSGLKIGITELLTKMILYYFHERIWFKISIFKEGISHARHILKTFTWRFIGTLDTIILSWWITDNATIGLTIGGFEVLTKMILYYLHERIWYKTNFGLKIKNKNA